MRSTIPQDPKRRAIQLALASLGLSVVSLIAYGLSASRAGSYGIFVVLTVGALAAGGLGSLLLALRGRALLRQAADRPIGSGWVRVSLAVALADVVVLGIICLDLVVYAWLR